MIEMGIFIGGLICGVVIMRYAVGLGGRIVQDATSEMTILGGEEPTEMPSHTTLDEKEKEV